MASGYALPSAGGNRNGHIYSHSYSGIHLSPQKPISNGFANANGLPVKKATSNGSLYTHVELSRENSPSAELNQNHNHYPGFEQNALAVQENARVSRHAYSRSDSPMKGRSRGESDLGRPADPRHTIYHPVLESISAVSTSWFSLPEALTSLLVPLPYLFASASYSSMLGWTAEDFPPFAVYERPSQSPFSSTVQIDLADRYRSSGLLETCILTSSTLLLTGILAKMQSAERVLDRRKASSPSGFSLGGLASGSALKAILMRTLSIALPFYAAMQLGGTRVGLLMLVAIAADLRSMQPSFEALKDVWSAKVATSSVMVLCFIMDEAGFTLFNSLQNVVLGYLALALSILFLQPPLPGVSGPGSRPSSPALGLGSVVDANCTLAAGVILAVFTILASMLTSTPPTISTSTIILTTLTVAAMAASILFSRPSTLRSQSKAGLAFGCLVAASFSFLFSPSIWPGTVCNGGLSALSFIGVLYDTNASPSSHKHDHDHAHAHNAHTHHHHAPESEAKSAFTKFVMARCEPGLLVYGILNEKDSRRIAYFTT